MEEKADFSGACQNEVLPEITEKLGHLTFHSTEELISQQQHMCKLCQKSPGQHLLMHINGDKPSEVDTCPKVFQSNLNIEVPTLTEFDDDCHRTYKTRNFSQTHLRTRAGHRRTHISQQSGKCNICCSTHMRSCAFGVHLHRDTGKLLYECDVCHRSFPGRYALEAHICTRTRKKSDVRQIAFFRHGKLKENVCTHTGEKSDHCKVCLKKFLKQELKDPAYECNVCHKQFLSCSILKAHRATHSGEKRCLTNHCFSHGVLTPFVCEVCQLEFKSYSVLNAHRARHGEFPSYSVLNDHRATHMGEDLYVCDVCDKEFSSLIILIDHQATHVEVNPYVCDVCSEAFSSNENLKAHLCIQAVENMCL